MYNNVSSATAAGAVGTLAYTGFNLWLTVVVAVTLIGLGVAVKGILPKLKKKS